MHGSSGEASTSKTSPPVPAKTPALPAATPTPAKRDVATPPAEKQGVAPAPGLVELSQEERIAYKNYWQTFKSPKDSVGTNAPASSHTSSPLNGTGSPSNGASETPSSTGVVTPDVKKKLDLDPEGLFT